MEGIRDALLRLYKAGRKSEKMSNDFVIRHDDALEVNGLILDAIYCLLGEHTESFDTSITCKVLSGNDSETTAVDKLLIEYKKNRKNIAPITTDPEKINQMMQNNGGYASAEFYERVSKRQEEEALQLRKHLKEAGNELCYKCGQYREEYRGACNDCRWRYVKHGEMPT